MNISIVDQSKAKEINYYGEMVRLGNEFRNKKDHIINKVTKIEALIPAKTDGFDFETCMESDLKKWLASNKKKSPSHLYPQIFPTGSINLRSLHDCLEKLRKNNFNSEFRDLADWVYSHRVLI